MSCNLRTITQILDDSDDDDSDIRQGNVHCAFIPDANEDDNISESEDDEDQLVPTTSTDDSNVEIGRYEKILENYNESQKLLEESHTYIWENGQAYHSYDLENKNFLNNDQKQKIKHMSKLELYELFFSQEMKNIIIEATRENDFDLSLESFQKFMGILILSIMNSRKNVRDYWSNRDSLRCKIVAETMSRNEFLKIKRFMKFAKTCEKNVNDEVWRVRTLIEKFRLNLQQFGYFMSNMSIDESMIEFFGRLSIKQFMPKKPIRFGIKLWSLCTVTGFLLDFQIYCGKESRGVNGKLKNCSLGSRVVMTLLHDFLKNVPSGKLKDYHVAFDNFFTNPDLMVHLQNIGLKATGTVRQNRVYEIQDEPNKQGKYVPTRKVVKVDLDSKSPRGSMVAKVDIGSSVNYISVKDSKPVSILTTAASVEPLTPVSRYNKTEKRKTEVNFPFAFSVYNQNMGGVDLHDQHCSDLKIHVKSKKWTWAIFKKIIETSISNSFIISKLCKDENQGNSSGVKEFALEIAEEYLTRDEEKLNHHSLISSPIRRVCSVCKNRTSTICLQCQKQFCVTCFNSHHKVVVHKSTSGKRRLKCVNKSCEKFTTTFCEPCDSPICAACYNRYHVSKKLKTV